MYETGVGAGAGLMSSAGAGCGEGDLDVHPQQESAGEAMARTSPVADGRTWSAEQAQAAATRNLQACLAGIEKNDNEQLRTLRDDWMKIDQLIRADQQTGRARHYDPAMLEEWQLQEEAVRMATDSAYAHSDARAILMSEFQGLLRDRDRMQEEALRPRSEAVKASEYRAYSRCLTQLHDVKNRLLDRSPHGARAPVVNPAVEPVGEPPVGPGAFSSVAGAGVPMAVYPPGVNDAPVLGAVGGVPVDSARAIRTTRTTRTRPSGEDLEDRLTRLQTRINEECQGAETPDEYNGCEISPRAQWLHLAQVQLDSARRALGRDDVATARRRLDDLEAMLAARDDGAHHRDA